jgi:hypothetical protein
MYITDTLAEQRNAAADNVWECSYLKTAFANVQDASDAEECDFMILLALIVFQNLSQRGEKNFSSHCGAK